MKLLDSPAAKLVALVLLLYASSRAYLNHREFAGQEKTITEITATANAKAEAKAKAEFETTRNAVKAAVAQILAASDTKDKLQASRFTKMKTDIRADLKALDTMLRERIPEGGVQCRQ